MTHKGIEVLDDVTLVGRLGPTAAQRHSDSQPLTRDAVVVTVGVYEMHVKIARVQPGIQEPIEANHHEAFNAQNVHSVINEVLWP